MERKKRGRKARVPKKAKPVQEQDLNQTVSTQSDSRDPINIADTIETDLQEEENPVDPVEPTVSQPAPDTGEATGNTGEDTGSQPPGNPDAPGEEAAATGGETGEGAEDNGGKQNTDTQDEVTIQNTDTQDEVTIQNTDTQDATQVGNQGTEKDEVGDKEPEETERDEVEEAREDDEDDADDEDLWANGKEEQLIELYRSHEFLWNKASRGYAQRRKKMLTYDHFSKQLGIPVSAISARVKTLRDAYTKNTGQQASGSGRRILTARNKYIVKAMGFIRDHIRNRQTFSSMEAGGSDENAADGNPPAAKRKSPRGNKGKGTQSPKGQPTVQTRSPKGSQEKRKSPRVNKGSGAQPTKGIPPVQTRSPTGSQDKTKSPRGKKRAESISPRSPTPPPKRPQTSRMNTAKRVLNLDASSIQTPELLQQNLSTLPSVIANKEKSANRQNAGDSGSVAPKGKGRGKNRFLTVDEAKEIECKRTEALGEISEAIRDVKSKQLERPQLSETGRWAELLAMKVERLPAYVRDDFKFAVDEMVYKAGKGLWHPSMQTGSTYASASASAGSQEQLIRQMQCTSQNTGGNTYTSALAAGQVAPQIASQVVSQVAPQVAANTSHMSTSGGYGATYSSHLQTPQQQLAPGTPRRTQRASVSTPFTAQEVNDIQHLLTQSPRIGPAAPSATRVSPDLLDKLNTLLGTGTNVREYEGVL